MQVFTTYYHDDARSLRRGAAVCCVLWLWLCGAASSTLHAPRPTGHGPILHGVNEMTNPPRALPTAQRAEGPLPLSAGPGRPAHRQCHWGWGWVWEWSSSWLYSATAPH